MTRTSQILILLTLLSVTAFAQTPRAACRTISVASDNPHLSEKYVRTHLAFNVGLQDGSFSFTDGDQADIVVQVRRTLPDSIFRLAVRVSHSATGETREALHEDVSREAKERVAQDVARAILSFCPTPRFDAVLAAAARAAAPVPVVVVAPAPATAPAAASVTEAPACELAPIHAISVYSATSSLDERDLLTAIAKDPLARQLKLRAELAPAEGAQVTVKRELGTSFWSFTVNTPAGGFCQRELFVLREGDAPRRLARDIIVLVAESLGQPGYADERAVESREFKVEAFGGLNGVKQGTRLVLAVSGKELVITTPTGFLVARVPARALQDVNTHDYAPSFSSDAEADAIKFMGADPISAAAVLTVVTAYAVVNHFASFTRNMFTTEHFLGFAWKDGATVKTASFKVRGRDTKTLRSSLEQMVESARVVPGSRRAPGPLLTAGK